MHLRVLREAGVVVVRARGTTRLSAVQPEVVEQVGTWPRPSCAAGPPLDAPGTQTARGATGCGAAARGVPAHGTTRTRPGGATSGGRSSTRTPDDGTVASGPHGAAVTFRRTYPTTPEDLWQTVAARRRV